jgi:hypothetical protein
MVMPRSEARRGPRCTRGWPGSRRCTLVGRTMRRSTETTAGRGCAWSRRRRRPRGTVRARRSGPTRPWRRSRPAGRRGCQRRAERSGCLVVLRELAGDQQIAALALEDGGDRFGDGDSVELLVSVDDDRRGRRPCRGTGQVLTLSFRTDAEDDDLGEPLGAADDLGEAQGGLDGVLVEGVGDPLVGRIVETPGGELEALVGIGDPLDSDQDLQRFCSSWGLGCIARGLGRQSTLGVYGRRSQAGLRAACRCGWGAIAWPTRRAAPRRSSPR